MQKNQQYSKVEQFLQAESTLVLSVIDNEGAVHSAPLFYWLGDGLRFYWISSDKSRHSECLLANPNVAAAVYHSTFKWRQIAGVQMEGTAFVIDGEERKIVLEGYKQRFHLNHLFAAILSASTLYCFQPKWVRYTDNHKIFSEKFELTLE